MAIIKMEVRDQPLQAIINVNDTVICHPSPYEIQFYGSGESIPFYIWDFGDGTSSFEPNPLHSYNSAGEFLVSYIVIDSSTCEIRDATTITFKIAQKESFSADWIFTEPQSCVDQLEVNMAFTGTGADSLLWDMGDGTFYSDFEINHTYFNPGFYLVQLTAIDLDCDNSSDLTQPYEVDGGIKDGIIDFPNVFSPNGDGMNDEFHAYYPENEGSNPLRTMTFYQVKIFDRWGRQVFESINNLTTSAWNGEVDGNAADEGVYFYIVEYESKCDAIGVQRKTGYLTLVR